MVSQRVLHLSSANAVACSREVYAVYTILLALCTPYSSSCAAQKMVRNFKMTMRSDCGMLCGLLLAPDTLMTSSTRPVIQM